MPKTNENRLAIVAHEMRSPLAAISQAVAILRLRAPDPSAIQMVEGVIGRQLHQLERLVNDLLDVEGIAAGQIALKREPVNLVDVAIRAVETTRSTLTACEHRLEFDLPRTPLLVQGDADRLTQVLINLLDNAAHYTPRGGHIFLSLASEPDHALICVRDTGMGIGPDLLPCVFNLFVRDPSHRVAGSRGIGLALAKELVEAHGGTIRAESEGHERGSQFLVQLPQLLTQDLNETRSPDIASPASLRCASKAVRTVSREF